MIYMNNKLKYLIVGILIISGLFAVSAAVTRQPNDYFVFASTFVDIVPSPVDDNKLDLTVTAYYIPLTASQTWTLTVRPVTATINISQPAQIQNKVKTALVDEGISRG